MADHPYVPRDLQLPGYVPVTLSMSSIVTVYALSSLLVVSLVFLFSGLSPLSLFNMLFGLQITITINSFILQITYSKYVHVYQIVWGFDFEIPNERKMEMERLCRLIKKNPIRSRCSLDLLRG